jgi:hypothetical protein
MPVTDHQVATLRALLAGDLNEYARLRAQLDREADRSGYSALIAAAFFEAADRRFAAGHDRAAITEFVASARAASPGAAEKIDPLFAERMIRGVFEDVGTGDVGGQVLLETQLLLLAALAADARFGPAELDDFMVESRKTADRWLSERA